MFLVKEVTWTTGQKGNPKLGVGGFFFTFQRKLASGIPLVTQIPLWRGRTLTGSQDWQCEKRSGLKCRARATLSGDLVLVKLPKPSEHNHAAVPQKIDVLEARKKAKDLGEQGTPSTGAVVRDAYRGLSENAIALLPNEKSLKRRVQVQRKNNRKHPGIPVAVNDIPHELPEEFRLMKDGSRLLIADEKTDNKRLLMFSTEKQLEILSRSDHLFADRTFKVVPSTHKQMFSVHVALHGDVVPVCYALCSDFTEATYTRVLRIRLARFPSSGISCYRPAEFGDADIPLRGWTAVQRRAAKRVEKAIGALGHFWEFLPEGEYQVGDLAHVDDEIGRLIQLQVVYNIGDSTLAKCVARTISQLQKARRLLQWMERLRSGAQRELALSSQTVDLEARLTALEAHADVLAASGARSERGRLRSMRREQQLREELAVSDNERGVQNERLEEVLHQRDQAITLLRRRRGAERERPRGRPDHRQGP